MQTKYTTVSIPKPLYAKAKKVIEGTGFTSVSDFVTYILRDIISAEPDASPEELERVRKKLKALGYL
jgi:metal-responsive CopG/Arc/MetJ family transcriptional regulator